MKKILTNLLLVLVCSMLTAAQTNRCTVASGTVKSQHEAVVPGDESSVRMLSLALRRLNLRRKKICSRS